MALAKYAEEIQEAIYERMAMKEQKLLFELESQANAHSIVTQQINSCKKATYRNSLQTRFPTAPTERRFLMPNDTSFCSHLQTRFAFSALFIL